MRKATHALAVTILGFLSTVLIGVAAVLTAAITLAATALIVPGTGTHNINPPVQGYKENAADRFIGPATLPVDSSFYCTSTNGCNLVGIDYPASFWPIPLPGWCPGLSCDTWNESVGTGVTNLDAEISELLDPLRGGDPDADIVLFGYSQGGAVVSHEMYRLAQQYPDKLDQFTVVTIGNIENPQGLWARFNFLPGLTIPILNVTFGPQLPTDIGIKSTNYVFEYDPVGDAPLNWWNGLAVLNALFAFQYVHGNYLVPNTNDPQGALPYGYTEETLAETIDGLLENCTEGPGSNCRTYQDATFVLIPWQGTLPLLQPIVDLAAATGTTPIVKPLIDLIQPALKVLIDLGYDRTANPGIPRTLNLLPIFNPIKLAVDLIAAVGEGIRAFINDVTGQTSGLSTTSTISTTSTSTFALQRSATDEDSSRVRLQVSPTNDNIGGMPGDNDIGGNPADDNIGGNPSDDNIGGKPGDGNIGGKPGDGNIDGKPGDDNIDGKPGDDNIGGNTATDPSAITKGNDPTITTTGNSSGAQRHVDLQDLSNVTPFKLPELPDAWKPGNLFVPHVTTPSAGDLDTDGTTPDPATGPTPGSGDDQQSRTLAATNSQPAAA